MSRFALHGFACDLPPGWEVTAYDLSGERGELRCNERLVPRARLAWMRAAAPDLERFVREAVAKDALEAGGDPEAPMAAPKGIRQIGEFTVAWAGPGRSCQAAAYIPHDHRLLHWTFLEHRESSLNDLWAPVLRSHVVRSDGLREWSCFGIRSVLPREFAIEDLDLRPAAVALTMARKDGLLVRLRRLGMARVLLDRAPLHHLFRGLLVSDKAKIAAIDVEPFRGHPAVRARYFNQGEQTFERVFWRRRPGEGILWQVEAENRLYSVEQVGPARARRLELADVVS